MKNIVGLAALVFVVNFITMPANEYVGDAMAVRVSTINFINHGQIAVPAEVAHDAGAPGQYFYENRSGAFYPKYGVLNTFIYLPPLWLEKLLTGNLPSTQHTLFLNLFNIVLSCGTAGYLALLARRYTNSIRTVSIFVLASLYCTFWWNYLRAQTFEIYLTLFLLAFCCHFLSAREHERGTLRNLHLLTAAICLSLLCLCKTVYIILLPVVAVFIVTGPTVRGGKFVGSLLFFWVPLAIFICVLFGSNWYRFGSPFELGYTQWSQEARPFTANLWPGLSGFLFGKQGNLFLHFPVLIFALMGWPRFFKKHKPDAALIITLGAIVLMVSSSFTNWKGESCYGPRYLLPVLPLVSLPFLSFGEWLDASSAKLLQWIAQLAVAAVLSYACLLQIAVNSLPFFFWYDLAAVIDNEPEGRPARYLCSHQFGSINIDFIRYAKGKPSQFQRDFVPNLDPTQFLRLEVLEAETALNYFWYRRPVEALQ